MTLRQIADSVPNAVRVGTAVIAVYSAGIATNAWAGRLSGLPDEMAALREEIKGLRGDFATVTLNARRIEEVEDAICTPEAIVAAGPDRDRRCYAILRSRPQPDAP